MWLMAVSQSTNEGVERSTYFILPDVMFLFLKKRKLIITFSVSKPLQHLNFYRIWEKKKIEIEAPSKGTDKKEKKKILMIDIFKFIFSPLCWFLLVYFA